MAQNCPYCGSDTAGLNPCPHCGGALGDKALIAQARLREAKESFDWKPWALALVGLFVLAGFVATNRRHNPSEITAQSQVVDRSPGGKIEATPLVDLPPTDTSPTQLSVVRAPSSSVKAASAPKTDDQSDTETTPTASQAALSTSTTAPDLSQVVQIATAAIGSQQDEDGNTFALGRVVIVNTGPEPISNYTISLNTGDGIFGLTPFEGSVDNPQAITARTIPPGGSVDLPVMTEGLIQTGNTSGQKIVTVTATEAGVSSTSSLSIQ